MLPHTQRRPSTLRSELLATAPIEEKASSEQEQDKIVLNEQEQALLKAPQLRETTNKIRASIDRFRLSKNYLTSIGDAQ